MFYKMTPFSSLLLIITATLHSSAGYFTSEPQDKLIFQDKSSTISLTCATDTTDTTFTWRRDDKFLDTSDETKYRTNGGTLDIKMPTKDDTGKYQCVAENSQGLIVSNYGTLSYAYLNSFSADTEGANEIEGSAGKGIEIPCKGASFFPPDQVRIYWSTTSINFYKSPGDDRYYVSPKTGSLYFSSLEPRHINSYMCEIRSKWTISNGNVITETSSAIQLNVAGEVAKTHPLFLLKPQDISNAIPGETVLFECYAGGNPAPEITWKKVGGSLPASAVISNAGQLLISNTTLDMAGTYECTASNSENSRTATAQLSFESAPQWIDELESTATVDLSNSISMQCEAVGGPAPEYVWLKDGDILSDSDKISIINHNTGSSLTLSNAANPDMGMYQCVAHNTHGYILTNSRLEVVSRPPEFVKQVPDTTSTYVGADQEITCVVTAAPEANISWTKDDVDLLLDGGKFSLVSSGLKISNVTSADAGKYTCKASNTLDSIKSSGTLLVYKPTVITKHPEDVELLEGENAELKCAADHDPEFDISWVWDQDKKPIQGLLPNYDVQGSLLKLRNVGSSQTGKYQCCVDSKIMKRCASATVTVTARPDPPFNVRATTISPTSQLVNWDAPNPNGAEITAYVLEGKNEYNAVWLPKVIDPYRAINVTYHTVSNLLPYNGYSYRVAAINGIGQSDFSLESSQVKTFPGKPGGIPTMIGGGGGDPGQLVVTWKPIEERYYGADQINYRINYNATEINGEDGSVLVVGGKINKTIIGVDSSYINVPYQVEMRVENQHSNGPFSEKVTVRSAELAPVSAPRNLQLNLGQAYLAEVIWDEVQDSNGFTKGYYVEVCTDLVACSDPQKVQKLKTKGASPRILIEDLFPYSKYKVRVAAFNLGGSGPWSGNWSDAFQFSTAGPPPDEAPSNVVIHVKDKRVTAKWKGIGRGQPDNPLKGYYVEFWLENESPDESVYKATGDLKISFDLPAEADYMVWVRGYNAGGPGRPSAAVAISSRLGTSAKYEGDSASSLRVSLTLTLSAVLLWMFIFVWQ